MMRNRQIYELVKFLSQVSLCPLGQNSDVPSSPPHRCGSYELKCRNHGTKAESSMREASQGHVRPALALSELPLSFARTAVVQTVVVLDTIMCGDMKELRNCACLQRSTSYSDVFHKRCRQNRGRWSKTTWFWRYVRSQCTWIENKTTGFRNYRVRSLSETTVCTNLQRSARHTLSYCAMLRVRRLVPFMIRRLALAKTRWHVKFNAMNVIANNCNVIQNLAANSCGSDLLELLQNASVAKYGRSWEKFCFHLVSSHWKRTGTRWDSTCSSFRNRP